MPDQHNECDLCEGRLNDAGRCENCGKDWSVPDPIPPYTKEDEKLDLVREYWGAARSISPDASHIIKFIRLAFGYKAERDKLESDLHASEIYHGETGLALDEARAALREIVMWDEAPLSMKQMIERVLGESTDAKE